VWIDREAVVLERWVLAVIALVMSAGVASAQGRTVVVELFTSEGCSSCPPADALLRQLNGTRTAAGDLIVGISEHVTYWNQLGWRDPFSSEAMTARQQAYGTRFHQDDVYTPQIVVNGEAQVLGSDRAAIVRAMDKAHRASGAVVKIASARPEGDGLGITFSLSGLEKAGNVDVFAVITEDAAESKVLRGENAGHVLQHVAVASAFAKVATTGVTAEKMVHLTLPKAAGKRHLIVFAQAPGLGPVLAADSVPM
jgi:hypothetical protein